MIIKGQNKNKSLSSLSVLILILLLSASFLVLSGCSLVPLLKKPVYKSSIAPVNFNYKASLNKWTRKADIYNRLNTVMFLRATYLNAPFRYAYTMEYAKYYMLPNTVFKKKLNKSYSGLANHITFFTSVYTPKKGYNNLDSDRSIWLVYLINNNGESVLPLSIKPAKQKKVFLKTFYPYVTEWSKQYIIKFPRYYDKKNKKLFINPDIKWIKLIITGVNGRVVLKWNIND